MMQTSQRTALTSIWDHRRWCAESLTIRNKSGFAVPFLESPAQAKLTKAIDDCVIQGRLVRIRFLKARQIMLSMGAASHIWKQVALIPGQTAKVYAHRVETAKALYGYYKQFEESWKPAGTPKFCKLDVERCQHGQAMEYAGGGKIVFGSAEASTGGRGEPFKLLHLSETAFWRASGELRTGLLQTVPDTLDSMVIDESTANGVGGDFHRGWQDAMDPSNKEGWLGVFCAWWEHPEYAMPLLVAPQFYESLLSVDEQILRSKYNLTLEQIEWRRRTIAIKCEGSLDKFRQEYPANPEEAFVASGNTVFDFGTINRQVIVRDVAAGELVEFGTVGGKPQFSFVSRIDKKGSLRVWKAPTQGHRYALGADTATGQDVNLKLGQADPDYSYAVVLDVDSGEQVASIRDRMTPGEFAAYICDVGQWYNWATVAIESTGIGLSTIEQVISLGYRVERLYCMKRNPNEFGRPPLLQEIGWSTSSSTKPLLISRIQEALRHFNVHIRDSIIVQELMTYVHLGANRTGARPGCHDDGVIALALAIIALESAIMVEAATATRRQVTQELRGPDVTRYKLVRPMRRRRR